MVEDRFVPLSHLFRDIMRTKGIRGLFKGYIVTLNRDLLPFGFYFWIFFASKDYLEERGRYTHLNIIVTGGIAGKFNIFNLILLIFCLFLFIFYLIFLRGI